MDMGIRKKIKIIITIIITIVSLITVSRVFVHWVYNRSILQARVNQIDIKEVQNPLTISYLKEGKKHWNLSEDEMKDIEESPQNYREVIMNIYIINNSKYISFSDGELKTIYQPKFKKIVIGSLNDIWIDPSIECKANNDAGRRAYFIVKCDGKTNEQIRELAKEISFTITGKTYSESLIFGREGNSKNYCKSVVEASKH